MEERLELRIKKLALAHMSGWEYMPGSKEAGSVLTDIFLEMMEENKRRYERIWEKHELEFLTAAPERKKAVKSLKTGLSVKTTGEGHGKWLARGTEAYTVPEQGELLRFAVDSSIRLTSSVLRYAIYQKGLCAWLAYEGKAGEGQNPVFHQSLENELKHPVFQWRFQNLCNGRQNIKFEVKFHVNGENGKTAPDKKPLSGRWTVNDGQTVYPLEWRQLGRNYVLEGKTPAFSKNLEEMLYEIRLDIPPEEELNGEWLEVLCRGFSLWEKEQEQEPDFCVTDEGAYDGQRLYPFGKEPDAASCCYLACDNALALKDREITLQFTESFEREERLAPSRSKEYQKLYKKYPWLQDTEEVQEWKVQETVWQYFNGKLWRTLPGSGEWRTGCLPGEAKQRVYRWKRPEDMQPCAVEGEEHFYIRLRLERVSNAYAPYYRKEIPVLERICFAAGEHRAEPVGRELPDPEEAGRIRMLLGFDREVTPDNRWYTGSNCTFFSEEQIKGRAVRYGREAFWVETEPDDFGRYTCFLANYVEIRQLAEEQVMEKTMAEEAGPLEASEVRLASGTPFCVETENMGVLDAVSVYDADYDAAGAPVSEENKWAGHYFTCLGRVATPADVNLLVQEGYPFLRVSSCSFQAESRELIVNLVQREDREPQAAEKKLPEVEKWLEKIIRQIGWMWLADCRVRCTLRKIQENNEGRKEKDGSTIFG